MTKRPPIMGICTSSLELVIDITVTNQHHNSVDLTAVIDTGFSGAVSIPTLVVKKLALPFVRHVTGYLADGSRCAVSLYSARVRCGTRNFEIEVAAADPHSLIGMQFLAGHKLFAQIIPGGPLTLTPI